MTPALAQAIEAGMMLRLPSRRRADLRARRHSLAVARSAPAFSRAICSASTSRETVRIGAAAPASGEGFAFEEFVDADHHTLAAFDRSSRRVLDSTSCRFM